MSENDRRKMSLAHRLVTDAKNAGQLINPGQCERCEKETTRLVCHHEDYDKPLDVVWLCDPCHGQLHAGSERCGRDEDMVPLTIRLPGWLMQEFDKRAAALGVTRSAVMRLALSDGLDALCERYGLDGVRRG